MTFEVNFGHRAVVSGFWNSRTGDPFAVSPDESGVAAEVVTPEATQSSDVEADQAASAESTGSEAPTAEVATPDSTAEPETTSQVADEHDDEDRAKSK